MQQADSLQHKEIGSLFYSDFRWGTIHKSTESLCCTYENGIYNMANQLYFNNEESNSDPGQGGDILRNLGFILYAVESHKKFPIGN